MARIGLTGKVRLRIRHFLRRSRHRAWRIHWRVTLMIAVLLAIPVGFSFYYFNVILPRNLKYSTSYDDWDFIYYIIIPMIICGGIATKLSLLLLDKQMKLDRDKWEKENERIRNKYGSSKPEAKESSNLDDVVIELQDHLENPPILDEIIASEPEQTLKLVQKPVRKPRELSRKKSSIYRDYIKRENPYNKFLKARSSAIAHVQEMLDNRPTKGLIGDAYIFTTDESDTLFEDFSIVYGNQVLAVQITYPEPFLQKGQNMIRNPHRDKPSEWKWERELFTDLCQQNRLIPCIYEVDPITLQPIDANGWNLRNALTEESVIPARLITAELIDMSAWELETQMIQFVKEYLQQEEEGLKFQRNSSFWKGNILWMHRKGRKAEWITVKRVNKFTQLTNSQKERLRYSDFSLHRAKGYMAQIIYKKENSRGGLSPIDHPKRGVNYEMEFEGLQTVK